jgi:myo-inositol-1(or 4)-monophosphatase
MALGTGIRRAGSGALGLAYVAAGRSDAYGELHINAWDVLAGILLVEEAGGWVSDFLADDGLRRGNPVLACTPALSVVLRGATGVAH